MKPIRLEVQGLQSYIEPVVVDFDALGRYGLFGIFGPIGSGKSSLLDALTLALYGLVDRVAGRSKKGVINADADRMEVRLVFAVRAPDGAAETYEVHRSYRPTFEDGVLGVQRIASRLVQLTQRGAPCTPPLVLADKEREVNDQVASIVGLCAEDFMRAVVLPQGRFRDVLHLKGSERRGMLQRIFRLSAYGAHLRQKLRGRQQEQRERLASIEGELQGLGPASQADLREAEKLVQRTRTARAEALVQLEVARAAHDAAARARRQHAQLIEARDALALAVGESEALAPRRQAVADAEQLRPQRGPAARWAKARARAREAMERQRAVKLELANAEVALADAEEHLVAARAAHDARAASLAARARALDELGRQLVAEAPLDTHRVQAAKRADEARERLRQLDEDVATAREGLAALEPERRALRRKLARVRVELEERRHVAEAVDAHRTLTEAQAAQEQALEAQHRAEEALAQATLDEAAATQAVEAARARRSAVAKGLGDLPGPLPTEARERLAIGTDRAAALETALQLHGEWASRAAEARDGLAEARRRQGAREARADELEAAVQRAHAAHRAAELAAHLADDTPCPVCGSPEHPAPAAADPGDAPPEAEAAEARQAAAAALASTASARERLEAAERRLEEARTQLAASSRSLASVLALRDDLPPSELLVKARASLATLQQAASESDTAAADRARLEAELQALQGEVERCAGPVHAARASRERAEADLVEASAAVDTASAEVGRAWASWSAIAGERTTLFDVPQLQRRIDARDAEARDLERALTEADLRREQLQLAVANGQQDRAGALADVTEAEGQRAQLDQRWTDLREAICGALDTPPAEPTLPALSERLQEELRGLHEAHEALVKAVDEATAAVEGHRRGKAEAAAQEARSSEAAAGATEAVREAWVAWAEAAPELARLGDAPAGVADLPPDVEQALQDQRARIEGLPDDATLATWREEVAAQRQRQERLRARVEALESDGAAPPTDEAFSHLEEALQEAKARADTASEAAARAAAALEGLRSRAARATNLREALETARTELDRLDHLGGLLRGDRFVEFVANDLLRELAATASEHLETLSEGRYALVLDSQGGFLVRDADAGGTTRPVTSLSGGESFLSALALALALSTQIQARGARPLEFFFLDEGFGSLDPEALDRVMSAIERLRDEQRVIGLISHVPGVRERVPMHLVVHPAGTRQQGSAVELRIQ